MKIQLPKVNLGSFALEQNLAASRKDSKDLVHHYAIEYDRDAVVVTNAFDPVPFASGLFDITPPAEINHVPPLRFLIKPIQAAPARDGSDFSPLLPVGPSLGVGFPRHFSRNARRNQRSIRVGSPNEQKIAGGALENLAFNRGTESPITVVAAAIRTNAVQKNSRIAGGFGAISPRPVSFAPLIFRNQPIVREFLGRRQITKTVP